MHDHDFEKQVHDKMEELCVSPSDAVWEQVDEKLRKKERRRRFLWIPLFFAALVTGGYFISNTDLSGPGPALSKQSPEIREPGPASGDRKKNTKEAPAASKVNSSKNLAQTPAPPAQATGTQRLPGASTSPASVSLKKTIPHKSSAPAEIAPQPLTPVEAVATRSPQRSVAARSTVPVPETVPEKLKDEPVSVRSGAIPSPAVLIDSVAEVPARDPAAAIIGSRVVDSSSFAIRLGKPANAPFSVQTVKSAASRKLHWGISVQGVKTLLNNGQVNIFSPAARDNTAFNLSGPNGNNSAVTLPSTVEAGYGFAAGVFVRKSLSRRVAFSTGLNYARASTSVRTGDKSAGDSIQTGSKNLYVNRYNFFEVPISFSFQLNRGIVLPLIWEAGLSVSYLVATNALHYNSAQNLYYRNSNLFNHTQVGLLTGLHLELFSRSAHPVRMGPQLQYGISRLLPESVSTRNHLLQYGFKISTVIR